MGRKRTDLECLKPFCYYCQKSFKNQTFLHHHQKSKHFKCPNCNKKFSSIDSTVHHCELKHKKTIEKVPNSLSGRDNPRMKIFGMQGVPRIEVEEWVSRQTNKYWMKKLNAMRERKEEKEKEKRRENEQKLVLEEFELISIDKLIEEEGQCFPLELKFES